MNRIEKMKNFALLNNLKLLIFDFIHFTTLAQKLSF